MPSRPRGSGTGELFSVWSQHHEPRPGDVATQAGVRHDEGPAGKDRGPWSGVRTRPDLDRRGGTGRSREHRARQGATGPTRSCAGATSTSTTRRAVSSIDVPPEKVTVSVGGEGRQAIVRGCRRCRRWSPSRPAPSKPRSGPRDHAVRRDPEDLTLLLLTPCPTGVARKRARGAACRWKRWLSDGTHNPSLVTRRDLPPCWAGLSPFHGRASPVSGLRAAMPRRRAHVSPAGHRLANPSGLSNHWKWPWTYTAGPVAAAAQTVSPPV